MAVGVDFLSKTKIGGMKDIMSTQSTQKSGAAQKSGATNSIFANSQSQKTEQKADVANMDSSSLINYVYNNGFKNNDIQLPNSVEFKGQDFATNGKKFDDVVKDICKQTGESKVSVESDLKKKYIQAGGASGQKGTSLNMQA
ncbi:MAG: hypothetical protein K6A44_05495 [bacterium]|nr:hypothetical protein [bacterium]